MDSEERKAMLETDAKYNKLNIDSEQEEHLYKQFHRLQETDKGRKISLSEFKAILSHPGFNEIPKEHRASMVWGAIQRQQYPGATAAQICNAYGISSGYYRELKRIHLAEWETDAAERKESNFRFAVLMANDKNITEDEWQKYCGWDRNSLLIGGGGDHNK